MAGSNQYVLAGFPCVGLPLRSLLGRHNALEKKCLLSEASSFLNSVLRGKYSVYTPDVGSPPSPHPQSGITHLLASGHFRIGWFIIRVTGRREFDR